MKSSLVAVLQKAAKQEHLCRAAAKIEKERHYCVLENQRQGGHGLAGYFQVEEVWDLDGNLKAFRFGKTQVIKVLLALWATFHGRENVRWSEMSPVPVPGGRTASQ